MARCPGQARRSHQPDRDRDHHRPTPISASNYAIYQRRRPSPAAPGCVPATGSATPAQAPKTALRRLARRHQQLSEEITDADREIAHLVAELAPDLLTLGGVGPEVAGQLLTSVGDNPDE